MGNCFQLKTKRAKMIKWLIFIDENKNKFWLASTMVAATAMGKKKVSYV